MADNDLDTHQIRHWHSILALVIFVLTNVVVLFPFGVPIYVPRVLWNAARGALVSLRVLPGRISRESSHQQDGDSTTSGRAGTKHFKKLLLPLNFVTAPLLADLLLLAVGAIGRAEVRGGTVGTQHIFPIDIMVFFLTLAYIAISIDASGLVRWLAFKVLQKGGDHGHRLFVYLYVFFFLLATAVGNDPVILSGTAFLAYMTRVSRNIKHPRAWIQTQFTIANVGSAVLVSSNPTNLVLAGAFNIRFIDYTANMVVPVVVTAIVLCPYMLYVIFYDESLVPKEIKLHDYDDSKKDKPVNPNIPNVRQNIEDREKLASDDQENRMSLEEIMNPFLDKGGAGFGGIIMATTLATILILNAVTDTSKEHPVYWVTLPAAFVMFCWDVTMGWRHRKETRITARKNKEEIEERRRNMIELNQNDSDNADNALVVTLTNEADTTLPLETFEKSVANRDENKSSSMNSSASRDRTTEAAPGIDQKSDGLDSPIDKNGPEPTTLYSLSQRGYRWLQETFPTAVAVLAHLPYALIPFALAMFVLVQALVTKGWVAVFAYGWDHWVNKTGTVGAVGGMAFLSVIMCNFAGTNIGTTILLCRVVQAWLLIQERPGHSAITQRTFWATVYSMALGVNYGAFSAAFSAALAGLLWRDILERKHIKVKSSEFARYNLPVIAVAMIVGCTVLVGEVYLFRGEKPYQTS